MTLNLSRIRQRLDHERRTLCLDEEILNQLPSTTRLRARNGSYHVVISSCLSPENADAAIAEEIEHHRRLGVEFEWKLYSHDGPPDLLHRLQSQGLSPGPKEAVLVCDLSHSPDWLHTEQAVGVARVDTLSQVEIYRGLESAIFPHATGRNADALAEALRHNSSQHCGYIAYAHDLPVSIGRLYCHPQSHFAGLYGGGTLPDYRGRGYYRALVAARARDAHLAHARYLLVDALPTSRPILERLGFQWLTDTYPCQWRP